MRAALLAATMVCGLATGARAAVFDLTSQTYNAEAMSRNAALSFELVISNAAVARGTFNLQSNLGDSLTGDVGDFVSAFVGPSSGSSQTFTANFPAFATADVSLTFAGGLASGRITFTGQSDGLQLVGTSGTFSGTFGSDRNGCSFNTPNGCSVTGQLSAAATASPVPEPVSMSLLGVGVLAGLLVRRRA